jgi:hypothetical protein
MSEVQAVLFDNKAWSTQQARAWLKKEGFVPIKRVDRTESLLRYRLRPPRRYTRFRVKAVKPGVSFVLGFRR